MDGMIESEGSYPPVYGEILLCPAAVAPALFDGVAEHSRYASLFDMRMTEYGTPVDERVYCNCDAKMFLVRFIANPSDVEYESAGCGACSQLWCLKCGQKSGYEAADIRAHKGCEIQRQREAAEKAKQYEGLTCGVDYQFCFKCHRSVQHDGGCNHMTCTHCHGSFCYVCGVEAKADSGHWREERAEEQELGQSKCLFVGVDAARAARKNAKRDQPGVDMDMHYRIQGYPSSGIESTGAQADSAATSPLALEDDEQEVEDEEDEDEDQDGGKDATSVARVQSSND